MNRKKIVLGLIVAIAAATVAGLSAFRYLEDRTAMQGPATESDDGQPVVVAARPLELGSVITAEDVRTVRWPAGSVPAGYVSHTDDVVGRGVTTDVGVDEPLLDAKLADPSAGGGLPITIPPGMRAVSVRVDEVIGVAGFVIPGTRVDVLLTLNGDDESRSRVILQNVRAVAAGQEIRQDEDGSPMTVTVITLLVDLEDAEKLVLAASEGRIQLALRNTMDTDSVGTEGSRASRLLDGDPQPATVTRRRTAEPRPPSNEPDPGVVEVYRGGVRSLISY